MATDATGPRSGAGEIKASPLPYTVYGPSPAEARGVLLVLHGLGQSPDAIWSLFRDAIPDGVLALFPRGAFAGPDGGPRSAWFQVEFMPEGRRVNLDQEKESRAALIGLLEAVRTQPALAGKSVAMTGFSQGGIESINVALDRPDLLDGVALANARLMQEVAAALPPRTAHRGFPLLWAHADREPVLPFEEAVKGRARLREYGFAVEPFDFVGVENLSKETTDRLRAWLDAIFSNPRAK